MDTRPRFTVLCYLYFFCKVHSLQLGGTYTVEQDYNLTSSDFFGKHIYSNLLLHARFLTPMLQTVHPSVFTMIITKTLFFTYFFSNPSDDEDGETKSKVSR